jgi:RNA polymerase sigma-70 factor (sigma-E family)
MMGVVPRLRDVREPPPVDDSLCDLYRRERWTLVRLASLLLHDVGDAEEVVQEAFVKTYVGWHRLRDPNKAMAYLRSAVLNGARSRLRHRRVADRSEPTQVGPLRSAESEAMVSDERDRVMKALRSLPDRQRECVTLRYYLDLPVADIATTLGISSGAVKTHIHRGLLSLATRLEPIE